MPDGKNSKETLGEISRLTKEKEQVLESEEHKRLLGLRSELQEAESGIQEISEHVASEFSVLIRPLRKFQRIAGEHSRLIGRYTDDPFSALLDDPAGLEITNILAKLSYEIRENGLCSKDKRAGQAIKAIGKMDSGYFNKILEQHAELSKKKDKLTDDINSIMTEEKVSDIELKIKQLKREAEQAKDEAKKPENTRKCPKCGEDIPADWDYHKDCGWKEEKQGKEEEEDHGKAKILVFTSPTCPHCPHALRLAKDIEKERADVRVTEISTGTFFGKRKAEQMDVMAVPTLFVKGPGYPQNIGLKGIPSRKGLTKAIDISLGLAEWEEPKGLFRSILDKLPLKIKR